ADNPGRLNLYEWNGRLVLIDFAHNEAGLAGLLDVSRSLASARGRRVRGKVRLGVGTAGDRTDEILHNLGVLAAGADDVVITEKHHYLRGRDLEGMNAILRGGIAEGGYAGEVAALETELGALQALLARSRRGDVVAVMSHGERAEIFAWLETEGYRPVGIKRLRELVGA
ncbi:MAG: Mur ligase, partial [Chloroflexota bacterium]|nr:Mur ligase [Chloroflexota bacterium]